MARLQIDIPSLGAGLNEGTEASLLKDAELSATSNFLPKRGQLGAIEKIRYRRKSLLDSHGWLLAAGTAATYTSLTGIVVPAVGDVALKSSIDAVEGGDWFVDSLTRHAEQVKWTDIANSRVYLPTGVAGYTAGGAWEVYRPPRTTVATGTSVSYDPLTGHTLVGFTSGVIGDVQPGDYVSGEYSGDPYSTKIISIAGGVLTLGLPHGFDGAWEVYRCYTSADDAIQLPATIRFSDLPTFDQIGHVLYHASNLYPTDSFSAPQTVTARKFYKADGGQELLAGFYLHEDVSITTTEGLTISVLLKQLGTFDNFRHNILAFLRTVQPGATPVITIPNVGIGSFSAPISQNEFVRVPFTVYALSGTVVLPAGEYMIQFLGSDGGISSICYEFGFGSPDTSRIGWAKLTGDEGCFLPLAEMAVYRGYTADETLKSATKILHAKRFDERTSTALSAWATRVGLTDAPDQDIHYLSDGFSIFTLFGDADVSANRLNGLMVNQLDYYDTVAAERRASPRFIGSIESWVTYQDYLVTGGIGGIGILDPRTLTSGGSRSYAGLPHACVPSLGSRIGTQAYPWIHASVSGTAYTYTSLTGVCSTITWTSGNSIYDVQVGDYMVDTSTAATAAITAVNSAGGTLTIDPNASASFDGGAFTITKRTDTYQPRVSALWSGGVNPGRVFAVVDNKLYWSGRTPTATDVGVDTAGDVTSWEGLATITFGDGSTDTITGGIWFAGVHVIWTARGKAYSLRGEPSLDPTTGYGTLVADYIGILGTVVDAATTNTGLLFFATDNGTKLWRMDASLAPQRIDTPRLANLSVTKLDWLPSDQQLWVRCAATTAWSYDTDATDDNTATDVTVPVRSVVWDAATDSWWTASWPTDTETLGAYEPPTFVEGRTAWRCGVYFDGASIDASGTFGYDSLSHFLSAESAGDDGFEANKAETTRPINSVTWNVDSDASFSTKEWRFSEIGQTVRGQGQIREIILEGDLPDATTWSVSMTDQDGSVTQLGTLTTRAAADGKRKNRTHIIELDACEIMDSFSLTFSVSGPYADRIRNLTVVCDQLGKKKAKGADE